MSVKEGYHHGDLRRASLEAGFAMLRERATDDLGLREVARAVGVSPTALYRHFPDKAAFLAALSEEGFERLGAAQQAAQRRHRVGVVGFNATGRAYVDFALANPALFRLMFSHAHPDAITGTASGGAMTLLRGNVEALADPACSPDEVRALCVHAWALVHGLAVLLLDGQLPRDDRLIDAAIDARSLLRRTGP
jgi:AcrR family transcriptional regulator